MMTKIFTDYQERWLTGIGLLALVGFIGWVDNFFVMWAFLGVIYMFAFYEAMKLFKLTGPSMYVWAALLWIVAYFYPNPDDLFFFMAVIFALSLAYLHNFDKTMVHPERPGSWKPPLFAQSFSHYPLHPHWGENRTFVSNNEKVDDPQIIPYDTTIGSPYYKQFENVYLKDLELTQKEKEAAIW